MPDTDPNQNNHHHHHHRSSPPVHALHKLQRKLRHTVKHMKKGEKITALAAAALLVVFAVFTAQKYNERQRTEAEIASWHAENALSGSEDGDGVYPGGEGQNGSEGLQGAQNGADIDYGPLSNNNFSDQLAFRRLQPFVNKEVLYNGQRYTRNTAVKAILLLGLDRDSDDLQEIRPDRFDQGQTDLMLLLAHNTYRNTVEVLQIPRDTMAAMQSMTFGGEKKSDTVEQITLAFTYGDGVYKSCELACDAVTRLLGGLAVDHYMLGDRKIITTLNDMVGGVTVTIPNDRAVWKDPEFVKGKKVTLHGSQAERFVRSRDHSDDFSSLLRMEHQKIYLQAFQAQAKRCIKNDPDFLDDLFDAVEADLLSDMNEKDYVKLAGSMLNTAQLREQDFLMLPGEARMGEVYLEYIPHYADINEMVLELFYRKIDG